MSKKRSLLLLVDSNALIHRAYHALPPTMSNRMGEQTNAVYGFTAALLHALETTKPTHVACCFDVKGATFRHDEYKEYKAHRKSMDDDLVNQIPRIYQVVEAFGIPAVSKEGFEADDLIGTLATKFSNRCDVVILTGDKDTLQLISPNIMVETFRQGMRDSVHYTPATMEEQYGITPKEFITFKALRGDPSDNIPGVSGVGEVTALKLVKEYHTLDHLYKALSEDPDKHPLLKGRLRENLLKEKDKADLSLRLATIDTNVPLDLSLDDMEDGKINLEAVTKLFEELDFRSFKDRVLKMTGSSVSAPEEEQENTVAVKVSVGEFLQKLSAARQKKSIAIAFAWRGKTIREGKVELVALAVGESKVVICDWTSEIAQALSIILADEKVEKCLWNVKEIIHLLSAHKIEIKHPYTDTMLIGQLLQKNNLKLANPIIKDGHDKEAMTELSDTTGQLFGLPSLWLAELDQAKMLELWKRIELPLVSIIAQMEDCGIKVDDKILVKLSKEVTAQIAQIEQKIWDFSGHEFNISSPQQLSSVLFEKLNLKSDGLKKRNTGFATDAETLETLKGQSPVVDLVIQYRELTKLKNTYLDALPKLIDPETGRLHSTFNQIGAATGRLSSNEPNMQNIPIRTELGGAIRQAFVADRGHVLLSVDYSQIELRILAHLSGDEAMKENFAKGLDIHTATAARLNDVPLDQVTANMRRAAKTINFGLLYGLSAHRLSKQLGIDYSQAHQFIERYFTTYPKIKQYLERVVQEVRRDGCYYTIFGRRRNFPDINSSVWAVRQGAERMAMNFPMQGSQADILKMAMVAVGHSYAEDKEVKLLLSVHDELVFEVEKARVVAVAAKVKDIMTHVCHLSVPLAVSAKVGENWAEMREID